MQLPKNCLDEINYILSEEECHYDNGIEGNDNYIWTLSCATNLIISYSKYNKRFDIYIETRSRKDMAPEVLHSASASEDDANTIAEIVCKMLGKHLDEITQAQGYLVSCLKRRSVIKL